MRLPLVAWACAVAALVVAKAAEIPYVDPDLWHEMSLAREAVDLGHMPRTDAFSYTPTVPLVVHHEWGAGLLWLAVTAAAGAPGLLLLKYLLLAGIALLAVRSARLRGGDGVSLALSAVPAVLIASYGFTNIRAQLLSMVALAFLLACLAADERGRRRWILPWLAVVVLWLNVHAGFVVGLGFLGLTAAERAVRREPFAHLLAVAAASAALVLVNPYGTDYVRFLARSLFMERPTIREWEPLWASLRAVDVTAWASMAGLAAYAVASRGLRVCRGAPLVAVALLAGLLHHRHLQLLAVTWLAIVPAWLAETPALEAVRGWIVRRRPLAVGLGALACAVWLASAATHEPWRLRLPTSADEATEGLPAYPVGAADYLARVGFRGRLMTPFVQGGYMMWRLRPQGARVSYDGRFEVAYPPEVGRAHRAFYGAAAGWRAALDAWPPDLVLVPRYAPVLQPMLADRRWRVTYGDDVFVLFAPAGSPLPYEDRRGEAFVATVP